jgi:hypothetical protein
MIFRLPSDVCPFIAQFSNSTSRAVSELFRHPTSRAPSIPEICRVWLGTYVYINCFGLHIGFPLYPNPNPPKKRTSRTLQKQRITTMPREICFPTKNVTVYKDGAWVKVLPQYQSTKRPGYDDLKVETLGRVRPRAQSGCPCDQNRRPASGGDRGGCAEWEICDA